MKKNHILFVVFIFISITLSAKQRSKDEAGTIASSFFSTNQSSYQKAPAISGMLNLVYTSKDSNTENAYYYVYTKETGGFVIVSGDDRANTILGYSDEGTFDPNRLPDGLKYLLDGFVEEIQSLSDFTETTPQSTASFAPAKVKSASSVAPLLGNIKWEQGSPYNGLCPLVPNSTNTCVTGCVATAMAQVMRYYQWPVTGTGSNSYTTTTNKIALNATFSSTQYDWANMTPTYSTSSTATQNSAVATLMFHCGVAVNMDYGSSSSATSTNMGKALMNNFGYDSNLQIYYRDFYNRSEWDNMIKNELNLARPVLYAGQAVDGGHQFVCDGYDTSGLFHINWGWSGMSNGYFQLSALNPDSQGAGGSSGGFNRSQNIVIGIQKPSSSSSPVYLLASKGTISSSSASTTRTGTTSVPMTSLFNYGLNTFSGSIGLALYSNNNFVQLINSYPISNLAPNFGWTTYTMSSVSIPTGVANGTYQLYPVYKTAAATDWKIIRCRVGTPGYLNVVVGTSDVTYSTPSNVLPVLSLTSMGASGNVYQGKTGRFSLTVANTGTEYNSKLGVKLELKSNTTTSQTLTEDANVVNGETRTYYFNSAISLAPGDYTLSALYDPTNTGSSTLSAFGASQSLTILTAPTDTALLTMTTPITFPSSTAVPSTNAVLSATIKNMSGYYDKKLIAFVFPNVANAGSVAYIGYQDAIFDVNEQKTVTFSGPIDLTTNTQYKIAVYWKNTKSSWVRVTPTTSSYLYFTLVDGATPVNSVSKNETFAYPTFVADKLYLCSEDADVLDVAIYDFSGRKIMEVNPRTRGVVELDVASIKAGAYVVKLRTSEGIKTSKFIKK